MLFSSETDAAGEMVMPLVLAPPTTWPPIIELLLICSVAFELPAITMPSAES